MARVRARSIELTSLLIELVDALPTRLGFEIRTPRDPARRAGMVTVWHADAERLSRGLLAQEVIVDYLAGSGYAWPPRLLDAGGVRTRGGAARPPGGLRKVAVSVGHPEQPTATGAAREAVWFRPDRARRAMARCRR